MPVLKSPTGVNDPPRLLPPPKSRKASLLLPHIVLPTVPHKEPLPSERIQELITLIRGRTRKPGLNLVQGRGTRDEGDWFSSLVLRGRGLRSGSEEDIDRGAEENRKWIKVGSFEYGRMKEISAEGKVIVPEVDATVEWMGWLAVGVILVSLLDWMGRRKGKRRFARRRVVAE